MFELHNIGNYNYDQLYKCYTLTIVFDASVLSRLVFDRCT